MSPMLHLDILLKIIDSKPEIPDDKRETVKGLLLLESAVSGFQSFVEEIFKTEGLHPLIPLLYESLRGTLGDQEKKILLDRIGDHNYKLLVDILNLPKVSIQEKIYAVESLAKYRPMFLLQKNIHFLTMENGVKLILKQPLRRNWKMIFRVGKNWMCHHKKFVVGLFTILLAVIILLFPGIIPDEVNKRLGKVKNVFFILSVITGFALLMIDFLPRRKSKSS